MSVRSVYRNNIFYYFLMPGIWFSGILIYLGLGQVYAYYIVFRMLVIVGNLLFFWDVLFGTAKKTRR